MNWTLLSGGNRESLKGVEPGSDVVRLVFQKDHSGGIVGDEREWGRPNLGKEFGGWSDGPCKKCGDQSKAVVLGMKEWAGKVRMEIYIWG